MDSPFDFNVEGSKADCETIYTDYLFSMVNIYVTFYVTLCKLFESVFSRYFITNVHNCALRWIGLVELDSS